MQSSKSIWFQCMLELIEKAEENAMEKDSYLEAEKQWSLIKQKLIQNSAEGNEEYTNQLVNQLEEIGWDVYNQFVKAVVCAVEFKDFEV